MKGNLFKYIEAVSKILFLTLGTGSLHQNKDRHISKNDIYAFELFSLNLNSSNQHFGY